MAGGHPKDRSEQEVPTSQNALPDGARSDAPHVRVPQGCFLLSALVVSAKFRRAAESMPSAVRVDAGARAAASTSLHEAPRPWRSP